MWSNAKLSKLPVHYCSPISSHMYRFHIFQLTIHSRHIEGFQLPVRISRAQRHDVWPWISPKLGKVKPIDTVRQSRTNPISSNMPCLYVTWNSSTADCWPLTKVDIHVFLATVTPLMHVWGNRSRVVCSAGAHVRRELRPGMESIFQIPSRNATLPRFQYFWRIEARLNTTSCRNELSRRYLSLNVAFVPTKG